MQLLQYLAPKKLPAIGHGSELGNNRIRAEVGSQRGRVPGPPVPPTMWQALNRHSATSSRIITNGKLSACHAWKALVARARAASSAGPKSVTPLRANLNHACHHGRQVGPGMVGSPDRAAQRAARSPSLALGLPQRQAGRTGHGRQSGPGSPTRQRGSPSLARCGLPRGSGPR